MAAVEPSPPLSARGALADAELRALDQLVEGAISTGREDRLPVLGFGEISLVLGWPRTGPRWACKRLPPFGSRARFERYRETLDDYLAALRAAAVRVVETEMRGVARADGTVAGYVVQPVLSANDLAHEVLRRAEPDPRHPVVEGVVEASVRTVGPSLGLDAQLSNWVHEKGGLVYIDVSTPLIWSAAGESRLDMELLAQAYPALLRPPLRRFVAPRILDGYRDLRRVFLDLTGNLIKQRLDPWLRPFLDRLNPCLEESLTVAEVRRYYRSDARLWAGLLAIRRLDRGWRRWRGRPYPFLLPGRIER